MDWIVHKLYDNLKGFHGETVLAMRRMEELDTPEEMEKKIKDTLKMIMAGMDYS